VNTCAHHVATWHTAQPLWGASLADGDTGQVRFRAPAILRFKGDDFMAQLQRALDAQAGVEALVLRPETWREEQAGWLDAAAAAAGPIPKLYQPAHYRFYLVTAALVCQAPGLPDRRIEAACGETASFVVRRLFPRAEVPFDARDPDTYDEYGWFGTGQEGTWRPAPVREEVRAGEERIPLSPTRFQVDGRPRRLLMGMIPVARRDVYEAGAAASESPASAEATAGDPFATEDRAVALEQVLPALEAFSDPSRPQPSTVAGTPEDAAQLAIDELAIAHALLLLQEYLAARCTATWDAVGAGNSTGLSPGPRALFDRLSATATGTSSTYGAILKAVETGSSTLTDGEPDEAFLRALWGGAALDRTGLRILVRNLWSGLEDLLIGALPDAREVAFQGSVGAALSVAAGLAQDDDTAQDALWAALLALADFLRAELPAIWTAIAAGSSAGLSPADAAVYDHLAGAKLGSSDWRGLLADADAHRLELLGGRVTPAVQVVALALSAASIAHSVEVVASPLRDAIFAALAERSVNAQALGDSAVAGSPKTAATKAAAPAEAAYVIRCVYERPRCKGIASTVVGDPSAPFQLASFFDPDAPVRPTRIAMPDISLKALHKAPRGVRFALSKELRAQIERVRGKSLDEVSKGELNPPQPFDAGLVCSLSIPIITIVALMILMVMVSLLNIVFWWMPFFRICLPSVGRKP
jgi:hypothetical protein